MRWDKIAGIAVLAIAGLLAWSSTYVWMGCKPEPASAQPFRFAVPDMPPVMRAAADATPGYKREAGSGMLAYVAALPALAEEDFVRFLNRNPGAAFPYFSEVRNFWMSYCGVNRNLAEGFLAHWQTQVRIYLAGLAHTAEFGLRGLVHLATGRDLGPTGLFGIAAGVIDARTDETPHGDGEVHAVVAGRPKDEPYARVVRREGDAELIALPLGRGLQIALRSLAATPTRVLDIAGNEMVLLTAMVPAGWDGTRPAPGLFANDVAGGLVRMGMMVPASQLLANIRVIEASGGAIEAVYP